MGIPSFLALPAARSDWADCMPCHPLGHMLLWTALLFLAPVPGTRDWLLLQTSSLVFQEGEPILLRCHSWRNKPLHKVAFFQNGKSKKFSYVDSNFSIPQANQSHSGEYHCTGFIGKMSYSSQSVNITVQAEKAEDGEEEGQSQKSGAGSSLNNLLVTIVVAVVAWIVAMAIAAAIAAWFRLRRKRISALPGTPKHREKGDTLPEEPANHTDAEEAAKIEAEDTITYSLLLHPEAAEGEAEASDYQNHI
ncbi:low affinity immunoglobulin gamma Fc region receptor II-b isoform X7 [Sus scrofa]|uniref:low affinity immunoglobulin gamma Fc region receptor II-b isoform X7 n=1 Tax=Sus scrofa TaxID=9823 RepID=UPI0006B1ADDF|nr:low affinity immunoglobulin gamma Fc region receptor II-b isoform X7 [Sus scrofa]